LTNYGTLPHVRIVGFGYKARTGKDFAARSIADRVPGCRIYAFSDAIAAYSRAARGMTVRDPPLLQEVGYELRQADPEIWVRCLYFKIEEDRPSVALITGVRFPNEVAMIRSIGGSVWRIDRVDEDGGNFVAPDRPDDHPTETALDGVEFDTVITNQTGRLDQFRQDVWDTYTSYSAYGRFLSSSYGLDCDF
jgi:hypothetical protein